jgi:hypothetical protein
VAYGRCLLETPMLRIGYAPDEGFSPRRQTPTCVIISSGSGSAIDAGVMACADAVTDKEKSVTAINPITVLPL